MPDILSTVLQLLATLPVAQLLPLLQTLLSVVTSLGASGLNPTQILGKLVPALTSITP